MFGAIILSLVANLSFAGNDLFGAIGSRKLGAARMSLYAYLCGFVLYIVSAIFLFRGEITLKPFLVSVVIGILFAVSYPLFLYTLEKGNATINGVIAGIFPIWVVLLSLIFFDETLSLQQAISVVIIFVGVILSTLHLTKKTRWHNIFSRYALLALVVSIVWGINFTFVRYPVEQIGWFETSFIYQTVAVIFSVILLTPIIRRSKPHKFETSQLKDPALNALTGFMGGLSYNFALTLANSSIVAPIAGSYPGIYAVASYYVFKETLTKIQITGVVLVLIGVIALSIFSL